LRAEARTPPDTRQIKIWKPLCTGLLVLTCIHSLTRPADAHDNRYTLLISVGLVLSWAGDVLLIFQANPRAFLAGLVAFLSAHLVYIAAFVYMQLSLEYRSPIAVEALTAVGLALLGSVVYRYLRPGLGKLRLPVLFYILAISVMVHRALVVAWAPASTMVFSALVLGGAALFYLSDAILAINKFRFGGQRSNYRLWNLTTYYVGQLLIALSASFLA
jgi:uncharacterized membrane protein YhhN